MNTVYLETTILSYLTAHISRDLVVAGHQQITREWWKTAKDRFRLFISEALLEEIGRGDKEAVSRRRDIARDIPVLRINDDVRRLTEIYGERLDC
jgi:hypothetical protein